MSITPHVPVNQLYRLSGRVIVPKYLVKPLITANIQRTVRLSADSMCHMFITAMLVSATKVQTPPTTCFCTMHIYVIIFIMQPHDDVYCAFCS